MPDILLLRSNMVLWNRTKADGFSVDPELLHFRLLRSLRESTFADLHWL